MNTDEKRKKITYDLTLEYVRANNSLGRSEFPIEKQIAEIDKTYTRILSALENLEIIK